uniref:SWIM-type domain-containing protein n=1 Tax=Ditylenchus dipsaci TaxID=166011 RepID=A0A915CNC0_9BILA
MWSELREKTQRRIRDGCSIAGTSKEKETVTLMLPDVIFRYKELRGSFYELKKSHVHPGYLCCTYPVGIKDELCKHSLLQMETEEMMSPLPRPLEPRKKRGREKRIGRALERI